MSAKKTHYQEKDKPVLCNSEASTINTPLRFKLKTTNRKELVSCAHCLEMLNKHFMWRQSHKFKIQEK